MPYRSDDPPDEPILDDEPAEPVTYLCPEVLADATADIYGPFVADVVGGYEPTVTVLLPCNGERLPEADVKFLDISEDVQGRDVLRFECPRCGQTHDSLRFG
jgi:hypothetical protein